MKFHLLYSPKGKQVFPVVGKIMPAGTMVLMPDRKWHTLDSDHVIRKDADYYDNLCQAKVNGDFYLVKI